MVRNTTKNWSNRGETVAKVTRYHAAKLVKPENAEAYAALRAGFEDAKAGRAPPLARTLEPEATARYYELGRSIAFALRGMGKRVSWPVSKAWTQDLQRAFTYSLSSPTTKRE